MEQNVDKCPWCEGKGKNFYKKHPVALPSSPNVIVDKDIRYHEVCPKCNGKGTVTNQQGKTGL